MGKVKQIEIKNRKILFLQRHNQSQKFRVKLVKNQASGYIEEKNGNECLGFDDSANDKKGLLKKYADVWDGIKNKIKGINGSKENDY